MPAYSSWRTVYRLILRNAAVAFSDASGSSCEHESESEYSDIYGRLLGHKPVHTSPTHRSTD